MYWLEVLGLRTSSADHLPKVGHSTLHLAIFPIFSFRFRPPDACYLEIMRFRVRPPKARELPMQARCNFQITGQRVEIRADMMIPYPHTKAWGQVPCEDVAMRIPLPECWIYQFRTEKAHLSLSQLAAGNISLGSRMGSVKSAHRRAGKVRLTCQWGFHDIISPIWIFTKQFATEIWSWELVKPSREHLLHC